MNAKARQQEKGQVQKRQVDPSKALIQVLNNSLPELKKIAPKYVNIDRLIALTIEAGKNPLLASCSQMSVINFCKKCAECGTDRIGAGGMWATPFWSTKTKAYEMVPIPDYRLLIEKTKKAKAIKHAYAEVVYEKDEFFCERGLTPILKHVPNIGERGGIKGAYLVVVLPDDTKDFTYMDFRCDVEPIRNRSNAWKAYLKARKSNKDATTIWLTDTAEMTKKTVTKRGLKPFEGASPELTKLIGADNVVNGFEDFEPPDIPQNPVAMPEEIPEADVVDEEPPDTLSQRPTAIRTTPQQEGTPNTEESKQSAPTLFNQKESNKTDLINEAEQIVGDKSDDVTQWAMNANKITEGQTWKDMGEDDLTIIVESKDGFVKMIENYMAMKRRKAGK